MNTMELMMNRKSCRAFQDKAIPQEVMNRLFDAAASAPSSGGFQNYAIIKVEDPARKKKLSEYSRGQGFIASAPVNLVFCIDLHRERRIAEELHGVCSLEYDYCKLIMLTLDAAIAAQNLCIAAEGEGLGSVYIGNLIDREKEAAELLNLPEEVIPVIMVTLGYPKTAGNLSGKYTREVLVHEETYEEKDMELLLKDFWQKYEGWNIKPSEKILSGIAENAKDVYDEAYIEKMKAVMTGNDLVDPLSFWYGYYYSDKTDMMDNEAHLKFLTEQKLEFWRV